ncbi:MAG: hypothetical protein R2734_04880 [Nocardioides sp.]
MDERTWSMLSAYRDFLDEAVAYARSQADAGAPRVGERLQEFLGVPPAHLPVVRLDVPPHQFVNLDVAMDELVETHGGGLTLGIGGGDQRHHQTFGDMVQGRGHWSVTVGAVDRDRENTGPHSSREVVTMGIRLFRYDGVPVAALQRRTNPQYGSATGLEVIAPESVTGPLLTDVRRLMVERSVYRGQVLSFAASDPTYGQSTGGISFLERPQLTGRDVVLPPGALTRIERHVAGAAQHRAALRAAAAPQAGRAARPRLDREDAHHPLPAGPAPGRHGGHPRRQRARARRPGGRARPGAAARGGRPRGRRP